MERHTIFMDQKTRSLRYSLSLKQYINLYQNPNRLIWRKRQDDSSVDTEMQRVQRIQDNFIKGEQSYNTT